MQSRDCRFEKLQSRDCNFQQSVVIIPNLTANLEICNHVTAAFEIYSHVTATFNILLSHFELRLQLSTFCSHISNYDCKMIKFCGHISNFAVKNGLLKLMAGHKIFLLFFYKEEHIFIGNYLNNEIKKDMVSARACAM